MIKRRPSKHKLTEASRARPVVRWVGYALAWSLSTSAWAQQISLDTFGEAQGMSNLAVSSIAQDRQGFIWAGTQNGAFRFDGNRFHRIASEFKPVNVSALAAIGDHMWMAGDGALWDWQDGRLHKIRVLGADSFHIPDAPQTIAASSRGMWAISNGQLLEVSPKSGNIWQSRDVFDAAAKAKHKELSIVSSITSGGHGDIWFSCDKAICHFDKAKLDIWGTAQGLPKDTWHWLLLCADGSLWARGDRHIVQLPLGANRFIDRAGNRAESQLLDQFPMAEDAQHRILTAERFALLRWDGRNWQQFSDGLPQGGKVRAIFPDQEGGIWVGQAGTGILRWRGYGIWDNWGTADGLPSAVVWGISRGKDKDRRLFAATGTGVGFLDEKGWQFVTVRGTTGQEFFALAADADGTMWAGTALGSLFKITSTGRNAAIASKFAAIPKKPIIATILAGNPGELFVATTDGLQHLRISQHSAALVHPDAVYSENVDYTDACVLSAGTFWLAGDFGADRYKDRKVALALALKDGAASVACRADGSVAVSDNFGGLHWLAPGKGGETDHLITPPGLQGKLVYGLLWDRRGWLWAATDAGLAVWDRQRWRYVDQSDGLIWNDTSSRALYEDSDGTIWVGTSHGLSHLLDPSAVFRPTRAMVILESVRWGGAMLPVTEAVRLAYEHKPLDIELSMPVYQARHTLHLQYRLVGFDDSWVDSSHFDIHFNGLPAGSYRFEARALDMDIGTTSRLATFSFSILPPWWATRYSIAGAVLLGLAVLFSWYRFLIRSRIQRERHLEAQVDERTRELRISRDRSQALAERVQRQVSERQHFLAAVSHDLRTPLTRVRLRTEMIEPDHVRAKLQGDLGEMTAMLDQVLEFFRGEQSSEAKQRLDVGALVEAMVDDYAARGIPITVEGSAQPIPAYPVALKRCIANIVDNAIRYGGEAKVILHDSAENLIVEIIDKGPGISEADIARVTEPFFRLDSARARDGGGFGLGLTIAREIVTRHLGQLLLENVPEGGLCVRITLPRTPEDAGHQTWPI